MSGTLTKYLPSKRSPRRCLPRSRETALDLGKALILNKEKQFCHLWLPDTSTGTSTACYTFKTKECMCIYIYNIYSDSTNLVFKQKEAWTASNLLLTRLCTPLTHSEQDHPAVGVSSTRMATSQGTHMCIAFPCQRQAVLQHSRNTYNSCQCSATGKWQNKKSNWNPALEMFLLALLKA